MDVERRVGKVDIARADAVAGGVEHMSVALLDGDRELLLRPRLQLAHLGLLVLRQIEQALRLLQFPQRQTVAGLAAHLLLAGVVRHHERQVVAKRPQGGALRTLPGIYALDQFGHGLYRTADGHAVIGQNDKLRAAVRDLVGNVERPPGERRRLECLAAEYLADAVVELGAGFPGIDVVFLAADDLAQVRLRQKAHRRAGAIVEIGGFGDELPARRLDEADVHGGR